MLSEISSGHVIRLETPLCVAIAEGDFDAVKKLVESKSDVNAANQDGVTPLMLAASTRFHNTAEIVEVLLAFGANRSLRSHANLTALDYAEGIGAPSRKPDNMIRAKGEKAERHHVGVRLKLKEKCWRRISDAVTN